MVSALTHTFEVGVFDIDRATVRVSGLTVRMDYDSVYGNQPPEGKEQFERKIKVELANAAGLSNPSNILITTIAPVSSIPDAQESAAPSTAQNVSQENTTSVIEHNTTSASRSARSGPQLVVIDFQILSASESSEVPQSRLNDGVGPVRGAIAPWQAAENILQMIRSLTSKNHSLSEPASGTFYLSQLEESRAVLAEFSKVSVEDDDQTSQPVSETSQSGMGLRSGAIAGIVVGVCITVALLVFVWARMNRSTEKYNTQGFDQRRRSRARRHSSDRAVSEAAVESTLPWIVGTMDRTEVEARLAEELPGAFLVRDSSSSGSKVLTIKATQGSKCSHHKLRQASTNAPYTIDNKPTATPQYNLESLIDYLSQVCDNTPIVLAVQSNIYGMDNELPHNVYGMDNELAHNEYEPTNEVFGTEETSIEMTHTEREIQQPQNYLIIANGQQGEFDEFDELNEDGSDVDL